MLRKIIRIDEEKCTGCELCLPGCPEGAIQVINGKARLISDLFCDGLGACLGHCPEGAITIEEREASPYDERRVIAVIAGQGQEVIEAHLRHLREHNQQEYLEQALDFLREKGIPVGTDSRKLTKLAGVHGAQGCPGSQVISFGPPAAVAGRREISAPVSRLTHWPIQLHLISPQAPHFRDSDLLLAADCVPFAMAAFHEDHLQGKTLAIACPKLDQGQEVYLEKLTSLVRDAHIRSLTVMIMQVPCCSGLLHLARRAVEKADRRIPLHYLVVGLQGQTLQQGAI